MTPQFMFHIVILIVFITSFYISEQRTFNRCEFGFEILENNVTANNWTAQIPIWICIADRAGYQTDYIDRLSRYGILMVNGTFCDETESTNSLCGVPCSELISDDSILESVKCANLIYEYEGWVGWGDIYEDCKTPSNFDQFTGNCTESITFTSFNDEETVHLVLNEGSRNETITCSVKGYPTPNISWFWKEEGNDPDPRYGPVPVGNEIESIGYLDFPQVQQSHAKNYTCKAENGRAPSRNQTFVVSVTPCSTTSDPTTPTVHSTTYTTENPTTYTTGDTTTYTTRDPTTYTTDDPSSMTTDDPTTYTTDDPITNTTSGTTTYITDDPSSMTTDDTTTYTTLDPTGMTTVDPTTYTTDDLGSMTTGDPTSYTTGETTMYSTDDPITTTTGGPSSMTTNDPTSYTTDDPSSMKTDDPTTYSTDDPITNTTNDPSSITTDEPASSTMSDTTTYNTDGPSIMTTDDPTLFPTSDTTKYTTDEPSSTTSDDPIGYTTGGTSTSSTLDSSTYTTDKPSSITLIDSTTMSRTNSPSIGTTNPTTDYTTNPNPDGSTTSPAPVRKWDRCLLAKHLTYLFNDRYQWNKILPEWLCLSNATTGFNSSYLEFSDTSTEPVYYGIFKISNQWCRDSYNSANPCNIECDELFDSNLAPSVHCSRQIYESHGFSVWPEYGKICADQEHNDLENCTDEPRFVIGKNTEMDRTFLENEQNKEISCSAEGFPPPVLLWDSATNDYVNSDCRLQIMQNDYANDSSLMVKSTIYIKTVKMTDKRKYVCTALNMAGEISQTINVDVWDNSSDLQPVLLAGGIFLGLLGLLAILLTFAVYRLRRKENLRKLYQQFKYGKQTNEPYDDMFEPNRYIVNDAQSETYQNAVDMPIDKSLVISPNRLFLQESAVLGSGAFGIVYKGLLDQNQLVAIKTLHSNANEAQLAALLYEVKIMSHVGKHQNIVQLYGVQMTDLKKGVAFVAVEYCSRGSLKDVLTAKRHEIEQTVTPSNDTVNLSPDYIMDISSVSTPFTTNKLLTFCQEVSGAMEFLAEKKIIHGDLAARNVLLDVYYVTKISDFGLSRQMYDSYKKYVKASKDTEIPWRWLAIETLKHLKFSSESDVWAFGVFMWEVFSLAELPYSAGISWSPTFVTYLESGFRLQRPKYATQEIFELMTRCWEADPLNRIDFNLLSIKLLNFLERDPNKNHNSTLDTALTTETYDYNLIN